jgi:hypothetical protein
LPIFPFDRLLLLNDFILRSPGQNYRNRFSSNFSDLGFRCTLNFVPGIGVLFDKSLFKVRVKIDQNLNVLINEKWLINGKWLNLSTQAPRNGNGKLVLPQLNRLHEAFKRSQIPSSVSSSSQDQQPNRPTPIPKSHEKERG